MRVNIFTKAEVVPKTRTLAAVGCVVLSFVATACGADTESNETVSNKEELTVTDVIDRTVTFDKQPERVVLGEDRAMLTTAMLDQENPDDHAVAMGSDLHSGVPLFETKLFETNPELKDLSTIGNIAKGDAAMENPISHDPDVVIVTLDHKKAAEESGLLIKFGQAGLKCVFINLRQKPLENAVKSVEFPGQIVDEQDNAKKFTDFYTKRVNETVEHATKLEDKPKTFVWRAAGLKDYCSTANKSNLGGLVAAAGGEDLGDSLLDTESNSVTAERALPVRSGKIIAADDSWALGPKKPEILPHVELGYTTTPEAAQRTLEDLLKTPGFDTLTAPKKGDLYAVFHQFYGPPYNVFVFEQFAKWIRPEEFINLDPVADFAKFHKDYPPSELSGIFFTALEPIK